MASAVVRKINMEKMQKFHQLQKTLYRETVRPDVPAVGNYVTVHTQNKGWFNQSFAGVCREDRRKGYNSSFRVYDMQRGIEQQFKLFSPGLLAITTQQKFVLKTTKAKPQIKIPNTETVWEH